MRLLVRLAGQKSEHKASIVRSAVLEYGSDLEGAFSVVTSDTIRIRRAPRR